MGEKLSTYWLVSPISALKAAHALTNVFVLAGFRVTTLDVETDNLMINNGFISP
jgi:hypothetical protein